MCVAEVCVYVCVCVCVCAIILYLRKNDGLLWCNTNDLGR